MPSRARHLATPLRPATSVTVGTAEFRRQLASYLKLAQDGQAVVIQERGRDSYLLVHLPNTAPLPSLFGAMRDRTEYAPDEVFNAQEDLSPGLLP